MSRCSHCDTCRYLDAAQKLCNFAPGKIMDAGATTQFWNHAVSQACLLVPPENPLAHNPERDYLEFFNHENGQYQNQCFCSHTFRGPKRATLCKSCDRAHDRLRIETRLQDIYCGLLQNRIFSLEMLNDTTKTAYYRAVFLVFEDWLNLRCVPFQAFNRDTAFNLTALAQLLVDLGVKPMFPG